MDFDALVLGTGIAESIAAAALSKAGYKVAHVDNNPYYGGDEASLTIDELAEWADLRSSTDEASSSDYLANQRARYSSISRSQAIPSQSRQYSVSLAPSIVPSVGPHIDSLVASGVSRYGQFKLLEKVAVYDRPGYVQSVPGSKEDVFKSKELSLMDKRRLMRFLMFAAGEFEGKKELEGKEQTPFLQYLREVFSLNEKAANAIGYALAFCMSAEEPTLPAMRRIRQYLRSAGRYGASPFLVGHYGGLGETAQGFCRTSAVKGGTYILGRHVVSVKPPSNERPDDEKASPAAGLHPRYCVQLEDFSEPLTARILISSSDYVSASHASASPTSTSAAEATCSVARCVAIIDKQMFFTPSEAPEEAAPAETELSEDVEGELSEKPAPPSYEVDTALLVFPPGCLEGGSSTSAAHVLVTGENSMSTPRGKYVLNISLPLISSTPNILSAEELLRPYLEASLTLTASPPGSTVASPLFTAFYIHHPSTSPTRSDTLPDMIITPPCAQLLPTVADEATRNAEAMFWRAVEQLKLAGVRRTVEKDASGAEDNAEKADDDGQDQQTEDVDSFWPPLDALEDDTPDEW